MRICAASASSPTQCSGGQYFGCGVGTIPRLQSCDALAKNSHQNIKLVIDPRVHGANLKVSNLINMLPRADYEWLVLADSDIRVNPDYLRHVTARSTISACGIVTCL